MGLFDSIFGGSESKSDPSKVWGQQSPFLRGLYERAYGASLGMGTGGSYVPGQQAGGMGQSQQGGVLQRTGGGWQRVPAQQGTRTSPQPVTGQMPGQQQYQDPLSQLGGNLTGQGLGMLSQLGMLGQSGNPFAQAQIGQLGQGLGRLFNQSIMPGITSTFAGAGQLGGSRQALALGQAGEGLGQAFTSGALDILGNSSQLALQANNAGLENLGSVFGAGNAGVFGSLPGLASLLGNPAILGGGSQTSQSNGLGGIGLSFGF